MHYDRTVNIALWGGPVYTSTSTVDYTYRVPYSPPAVLYRDGDGVRRVSNEGMPIPESDMNWLKRRVDEICWVPA